MEINILLTMAGKFEAAVEKNGQLTLKMKKFIVAQREKEKTPIDEIIRGVHKEFGIKTSKSAVYRIMRFFHPKID